MLLSPLFKRNAGHSTLCPGRTDLAYESARRGPPQFYFTDADRGAYPRLLDNPRADAGVRAPAWRRVSNHVHLIALASRADALSGLPLQARRETPDFAKVSKPTATFIKIANRSYQSDTFRHLQ